MGRDHVRINHFVRVNLFLVQNEQVEECQVRSVYDGNDPGFKFRRVFGRHHNTKTSFDH